MGIVTFAEHSTTTMRVTCLPLLCFLAAAQAWVPSTPSTPIRSRTSAPLHSSRLRAPRFPSQGRGLAVRMGPAQGELTPAEKVPFEIRGFSLAWLFIGAGAALTLYSFGIFFLTEGGSETAIGFVYGIPGLLLGLALKYAELEPVPLESQGGAAEARDGRATDTMLKIIKDVTRHRYGDEAHLEEAIRALKLIPRGEGPPELVGLTEAVVGGEYSLAMKFFSNKTPYNTWVERGAKYPVFFGPGVRAELTKLSSEERLVELKLITVPEGTAGDFAEINTDAGKTVEA